MKFMTADQIRETWLKFFESKGHYIEPSASLIPHNDPTLLWINSGVAALKKYFDGSEEPAHHRITNAQKAIRTNDIENVGHTARHHTFFEMLGNFSIGDYFRDQVIPWACELLFDEKYFGFPKDKIYITHHPDDLASRNLWISCGVDPNHLVPLEGNFWEVGPGPSGPDTEIFFDRGEEYDPEHKGVEMLFNDEDNDRYIEIWNIVFSQYNAEPGVKPRSQYKELPQKNIDTGAGLERLACVIQGTRTNFETDLFKPYIDLLKNHSDKPYEGEFCYSYQLIADHIRSLVFALSDGATFSNEGRGYVLRRLVRRLLRQLQVLNVDSKYLPSLIEKVVDNMNYFYPYLKEKQEKVTKMIMSEAHKFAEILRVGEKKVLEVLENCGDVVDGKTVFTFSDTYGIPYDFTEELALSKGKTLDKKGYEAYLKEQKEKARQARGDRSSFGKQSQDLLDFKEESSFTYEEKEGVKAKVIGLFKDGVKVDSLDEEGEVILSTTNFYAESGGQVADLGTIDNKDMSLKVSDVTKAPHGQYLHHVEVEYGEVKLGDKVVLHPDYATRSLTKKNHSAAHILQKALQEKLGEDVHQEGSFVSSEEMRFDFNYDGKISHEMLRDIEARVNEMIQKNIECKTEVLDRAQAEKTGAMALFNEKYGEKVRVVSFGDYSKEFCAGTHVSSTREIQHFVIVSLMTIAAGIKRITAYTGYKAYRYRAGEEDQLDKIALSLNVNSRKEIESKLKAQLNTMAKLQDQVESLESKIAGLYLSDLQRKPQQLEGKTAYLGSFKDLTHDQLLYLAKSLMANSNSVVMITSIREGKSEFCIGLSQDLVGKYKAGELVKKVSLAFKGSGGGRPDLAFGGFEDKNLLMDAYNALAEGIK